MKTWLSLGSLFKVETKATAEKTELQRQEKIHRAYQRVFLPRHHADDADKEIVLADLLMLSGIHAARDAGNNSTEQLWQDEGRRQFMLRILDFIDLPEADLRALSQAARREAAVSELDQVETTQGHDFS